MSTDEYHYIEIGPDNTIICSCKGEAWCSHIDATLVHGERAMVPSEDHKQANRAEALMKKILRPPQDWKSNWKSNRRWRGLGVRESAAMKLLRSGNPVVSIQGRGILQKASVRIARQNGWAVVSMPAKGVLIHVSDEAETDPKIIHAQNLGIMIVPHEQWSVIAPMGHILHDRMNDLLSEQNSS